MFIESSLEMIDKSKKIRLKNVGHPVARWKKQSKRDVKLYPTRGRGGLTHHLHSEAPAGNRRMALTFAKLRLIVFLRCIGLDWMPL